MRNGKLIRRLKKLERVEVLHMLRKDDITCAYYCEETDEIIFFVDIIVDDMKTHHKVWGHVKEKKLEDFAVKYLSRVLLHELMHWGGIESSRTCDFFALSFLYDEETASIITAWVYPELERVKIGIVELVWEEGE